jgi:hypothetical protein
MPVEDRTRRRVRRVSTKTRLLMRGDPTQKALIRKLDKSVNTLQRMIAKPGSGTQVTRISVKAAITALQTARAMARMASIGQCRIDRPYAQVRVVLRADGEYLCCNHKSPHCFKR